MQNNHQYWFSNYFVDEIIGGFNVFQKGLWRALFLLNLHLEESAERIKLEANPKK